MIDCYNGEKERQYDDRNSKSLSIIDYGGIVMEIHSVLEQEFRSYGKVLKEYDVSELLKEMEHTPLPTDVIYVPSDEKLESLAIAKELQQYGFGGLPIQIGYCNGNNKKLNALEYHRSSEINIAVTDLILLLGKQEDIREDFTYDTKFVKAFFVPKGTAIEVYATTLHYAPCNAKEKGFRCVVVLPKGTNTEWNMTVPKEGEASLMTAKNKWLIAHKEAQIEGAYEGLVGENIKLDEQ